MWQELRRRQSLVRMVLVASALMGLLVAFKPGLPPQSRQYEVSIASADILIDTSDSQLIDARAPDFMTLAGRANLLGNLIATGPMRSAIADGAGVAEDHLVVVPPANTSATTGGVPLPPIPVTTNAGREVADADVTKLTVSTDPTLPIMRVTVQAPDSGTASRLASETVAQVEHYLNSVGAGQSIPAAHKLVVQPLAAPTPQAETRGVPRILGLLVTILLASAGCAAIAIAPTVAQRWRRAANVAGPPAGTAEASPVMPADRPAGHRDNGDRHGSDRHASKQVAPGGAARSKGKRGKTKMMPRAEMPKPAQKAPKGKRGKGNSKRSRTRPAPEPARETAR